MGHGTYVSARFYVSSRVSIRVHWMLWPNIICRIVWWVLNMRIKTWICCWKRGGLLRRCSLDRNRGRRRWEIIRGGIISPS
jgi:hypothetical protein